MSMFYPGNYLLVISNLSLRDSYLFNHIPPKDFAASSVDLCGNLFYNINALFMDER